MELSNYLVISLVIFFLCFFVHASHPFNSVPQLFISLQYLKFKSFLVQSVQSVNLNLPFTFLQVLQHLHPSNFNGERGKMHSLAVINYFFLILLTQSSLLTEPLS